MNNFKIGLPHSTYMALDLNAMTPKPIYYHIALLALQQMHSAAVHIKHTLITINRRTSAPNKPPITTYDSRIRHVRNPNTQSQCIREDAPTNKERICQRHHINDSLVNKLRLANYTSYDRCSLNRRIVDRGPCALSCVSSLRGAVEARQ